MEDLVMNSTKEIEVIVKLHTTITILTTLVVFLITTIVSEILVKYNLIGNPMIMRAIFYLIGIIITAYVLHIFDKRYINRYNLILESNALLVEDTLVKQKVMSEEDYNILRGVITHYETRQKFDKKEEQ